MDLSLLTLPIQHQVILAVIFLCVMAVMKFLVNDYILKGKGHMKFRILTPEQIKALEDEKERLLAEKIKKKQYEDEVDKRTSDEKRKQESLERNKDRIAKAKS